MRKSVGVGSAGKNLAGKKPFLALSMIVLILSLAFSVVALYSRASGSITFSNVPYDVSNNSGNTTSPTVATSGQYVYVTWDQSLNSVYIRVNTDYGNPNDWENETLLSTTSSGGVGEVVMSVNDSYVYVAWSQYYGKAEQILFSSSSNYGQTFTTPIDVPGSMNATLAIDPLITPVLASWNSTVYLAWDDSNSSSSNDGSWACGSASAGLSGSWSLPRQLSHGQHEPQLAATADYGYFVGDGSAYAYTNNSGTNWYQARAGATGFGSAGSEPWIAASGPNVYLTSEEKNTNGSGVIKVWYSHDSGHTFTETIASGTIYNDWEPQIAAEGNEIFLAFRTLGDQNTTPPETISAYITESYNAGVNWSQPLILSQPGHLTGWPLTVGLVGSYVYTIFGQMTVSNGTTMDADVAYSVNNGTTWSTVDVSNNNVGVAAPPTDIESASLAAGSNGTYAFAVWQQSPTPYNLNSTSKYSGAATWQIYFDGPYQNPVTTSSTSSSSTSSSSSSSSTVSGTSSSVTISTIGSRTATTITSSSSGSATSTFVSSSTSMSSSSASSSTTSSRGLGGIGLFAVGVAVVVIVAAALAVLIVRRR
jgi:trimeric autotransporter adhesin